MLMLFRPMVGTDFDLRQMRIVEMVGATHGLCTAECLRPGEWLVESRRRSSNERSQQSVLRATGSHHCVAYARRRSIACRERKPRHACGRSGDCAHRRRRSARISPAAIVASRISGDRFALFCRRRNSTAERSSWHAVQATVGQIEFMHEDKKLDLSVSFGVARVPETRYPAVACARCCGSSLQSGQGSRPQPRRGLSGGGSQHHPSLRGRGNCRRFARCDRERSLPHGGATDRAARSQRTAAPFRTALAHDRYSRRKRCAG